MIERITFQEPRPLGVISEPNKTLANGWKDADGNTYKLSFDDDPRFVLVVCTDGRKPDGRDRSTRELVPITSIISISIQQDVPNGPKAKK